MPHCSVCEFAHEAHGATGAANEDVLQLVVAVYDVCAMHVLKAFRGIGFKADHTQHSVKQNKAGTKKRASCFKGYETPNHWNVYTGGRHVSNLQTVCTPETCACSARV